MLMSNPHTTAVDRFLEAIRCSSVSTASDLYAKDAVLDATVPGWRFEVRGTAEIRSEFGRWFNAASTLEDVRRHLTPNGEVVEYTQFWMQDGVEHAAHHVHVLTLDTQSDRIIEDHVWCGGRWPAPLLAEMTAVKPGATG